MRAGTAAWAGRSHSLVVVVTATFVIWALAHIAIWNNLRKVGTRSEYWRLTIIEFNSLELMLGVDAFVIPVAAGLLSLFLSARRQRVATAGLAALLAAALAAVCLYYPILVQRGTMPGPPWRYAQLFPSTLSAVTLALVLTTLIANRMRRPRLR